MTTWSFFITVFIGLNLFHPCNPVDTTNTENQEQHMQHPLSQRAIPGGWWRMADTSPAESPEAAFTALANLKDPVFVVDKNGQAAFAQNGTAFINALATDRQNGYPLLALAPSVHPRDLGDLQFKNRHNLRYAYIAGAMANGITSAEMVEEMARAGMIGFFGAAGLIIDQVEDAIHRLQKNLGDLPFGFNLIHSPNDPDLEKAVVELYLKHGISLVSASAYMRLTPHLVLYRVKGIHRDPAGNIVTPNKIIAKASRVEVARRFFSPPPDKYLTVLRDGGLITPEEAELARLIPMAGDLSAEADSGGHTDNRPALALLPTMLALRDELAGQHKYAQPICVGLGGGIATPESTAAAFAMGAAYVLTGTVNQACIEAGTSETVRHMLAEADQADVTMAPAADMFQMGVKVQVLKRGTLFPVRAAKLYDIYTRFDRFEEIPDRDRETLEKTFFKCSYDQEWENTRLFFEKRDPSQIEKAANDPKHKMALVFRSYLGRSSNWAVAGVEDRKIDYQIWCGPAIGAFNGWVKGTFLEKPENRKVVTVAMNLLCGAAVATRASWLRNQGIILPPGAGEFRPRPLAALEDLL